MGRASGHSRLQPDEAYNCRCPGLARGAAVNSQLPPGPRMPSTLQLVGWWNRPTAYLERCRARYGRRFTLPLRDTPPFVVLSAPDEIKRFLPPPPDSLRPGEGARFPEPVVGSH